MGIKGNIKRLLTTYALFYMIMVAESTCQLLLYYGLKEDMLAEDIINDTLRAGDSIIGIIFLLVLNAFLMAYLYFSYIKKGIRMKMRKQDIVVAVLYFIFDWCMLFFITVIDIEKIKLVSDNTIVRIVISVIIMMFCIGIPLFLLHIRKGAYYKELSNYQQTFLEAELNASRQYKAAQEDTRAFRHDVQNNLSVVAMLMEQGKIEEAQQYLEDMRTEVGALSPKVVTGDEMLDSLVSSKLAKMEELGIKFKLDGVIDGGLDWKPMDICTVFANMLDNAIEAAQQTDEPFIELSIKKTEHHRLVRAVNSCRGEVDCEKLMSDEAHITSKENKAIHGYGVKNIRKTVEKYGGMMRLSCEDNIFTIELILQKS